MRQRRPLTWASYRSLDDDDDEGRFQPDDSLLTELKLERGDVSDGAAELLLTVVRATSSGAVPVVLLPVPR